MEYMTIKQVMEALNVSRAYVYVLRDRGLLHIEKASPAFGKKGPARVPRADVERILARQA